MEICCEKLTINRKSFPFHVCDKLDGFNRAPLGYLFKIDLYWHCIWIAFLAIVKNRIKCDDNFPNWHIMVIKCV